MLSSQILPSFTKDGAQLVLVESWSRMTAIGTEIGA